MGVVAPSEQDELPFDRILDEVKRAHKAARDQDLGEAALRELVGRFKAEVKQVTGQVSRRRRPPSCGARSALCSGHGTIRAPTTTASCTASPRRWAPRSTSRPWCFGNLGDDCATGSRSPATRRPATAELYGEFLTNAQGEDVVAGIRTLEQPADPDQLPAWAAGSFFASSLIGSGVRDPRDHVLALGVGQELAVQLGGAGRRGCG